MSDGEATTEAIDRASLAWMPKSVWGPIKWKELHVRGLVDLPMDDEAVWFHDFVEGLPCPKCREHFAAFLNDSPPNFKSRRAFFEWGIKAHNHVNAANGKRSLSVEEARKQHTPSPD